MNVLCKFNLHPMSRGLRFHSQKTDCSWIFWRREKRKSFSFDNGNDFNYCIYRSNHWACSTKKLSLKISQNSRENTCAIVSFLVKLQVCFYIWCSRIGIEIKLNHEWKLELNHQKQPSRGVLRKRCSANMQQIYRRTPMPKCDFNKWVLSRKFAACFQNIFSYEHLWGAASESWKS